MPAIRRIVTAAITVVCLSGPLAWVARAQVPASGQPTQPSSPASGDDVLTEDRLPPIRRPGPRRSTAPAP